MQISSHAGAKYFPTDPDSSLASGTYGRILSAMDPRIVQLGLKLIF